jgi:hypothetical protein
LLGLRAFQHRFDSNFLPTSPPTGGAGIRVGAARPGLHYGEVRQTATPATDNIADEPKEGCGNDALVAAKAKRLRGLTPQGALDESPAAFRTEIEPQLLIDIVANLIAGRILHALQDILDLFEVVAVVLFVIDRRRIKGRIDLNLDDITEIILWIKFPLAQVT